MSPQHSVKRRSEYILQHVRRAPQDVVDQASQVGGGLASGRGDGLGGHDTASTPAATGGLASNRGDQQDTALAGGNSSSSNNAAPTSSSSQNQGDSSNNNGGGQPSPTSSQWMDSNNGGNQGDHSNNNQWTQPTSSQQQQQHQDQWQQPSSSSSQTNWNTWDNHNAADNGNTWQNTQEHNTWQQMSSSNTWEQAAASQTSSIAASADATASSSTDSSTASSAVASVSSGIIDTSNAVGNDGAASEASTSDTKSSKLGAGGTAGIVIAVLAILAFVAAVFVYRRRKRAQSASEREYGTTGFMSERFSTGSNFYQAPNASTTSGGFITFHDNASTHSDMHNVSSVGSIIHHSPTLTTAPPAMTTTLRPRSEQLDDDDASHYDHETVDDHGDLGRPSSAYYGTGPSPSDGVRSQRMPEYNLPTPPIPAFNSEEAIMSSRSISNNMAYIAPMRTATRQAPDERRGMNRSISSQNSYVDEQLRDLYVGHY